MVPGKPRLKEFKSPAQAKELRTCHTRSACLCASPVPLPHCTQIPRSSWEVPWAAAQGSLDGCSLEP